MFSFRTSPIEDQLDKSLIEGKVGVFCSQNCWDASMGKYLYDIFKERGNLETIFLPEDPELGVEESHIQFDSEQLPGLNAIVVEIQDVGSRYFSFTIDVLRLMNALNAIGESAPSLYVVDHPNPAGRTVEGTMPLVDRDVWIPKVAHRHGLTLGELAHLYYNEIGARFALHIISAEACATCRLTMPWAVAPAPDIPGFFTCMMYSGGALWKDTPITPGIGTSRPYEYFGAPFIKPEDPSLIPCPDGVKLRPCTFVPSYGLYEGEKCFGYQIVLMPGSEYHSFLHTIQLIKYFKDRYSQFLLSDSFFARLADPVVEAYLNDEITFDVVQEHVKAEEQKWIRKAKRFVLYGDQPYRIK